MRNCRDTPIWVDLRRKLTCETITIKATNFEEPRGLDLIVNLTNIGVHDAHLDNPADSILSAFTSDAICVLTHNPVRRMQPVTGFRQYAMVPRYFQVNPATNLQFLKEDGDCDTIGRRERVKHELVGRRHDRTCARYAVDAGSGK